MTNEEKLAAIANIVSNNELEEVRNTHFEPCPFCGSTELNIFKESFYQPFNGTAKFYYKMSCYHCDCEYNDGYGRTLKDLAEHWNKRGEE